MQASQVPANFNIPFASGAAAGYIRTIPQASQVGIVAGAASLTDGFPPLTFQAVAAGGVPPFGQDFNGILNQVTAWTRWQQAGGVPSYNAAFAAAIGGYPTGAILVNAAGTSFWRSLVDNNVSNPDLGGAGWGTLTAASYPWTSISGRPTDLAAFTNSPNYMTSAAVAALGYLTSVAWTSVTGRPTDLAAFTNGPGYMTAAAVAALGYLTSVTWTSVTGRPTDLSQFTNGPGYINASGAPVQTVNSLTGNVIVPTGLALNAIGYVTFSVVPGGTSFGPEGTITALAGRPGTWLVSGEAAAAADTWNVAIRIA